MERQFAGNSNVKSSSVGGVKTAANILNLLDSSMESEIIDGVKDVDGDLAETIEDLMFVFDNLIEVDDRGIQSLLKEVSSEDLVLALKGADENIKDKIFKNMSRRAADILRDDLESKGPVKLSDVEAAQKAIVAIARRMADAGEIILAGGGEEFV
jgi:flagellar motor switch protein FliG